VDTLGRIANATCIQSHVLMMITILYLQYVRCAYSARVISSQF